MMKVRTSLHRLCDQCRVVRREGTLQVRCAKTPRHNQRQG